MVGLPKSLCKKQVNVQRQEQLTETVNLRRKKKKKEKKRSAYHYLTQTQECH